MQKAICSEHAFPCEVWREGMWIPAWCYRKLTDQWWGILRVEAFAGDGVLVWETHEADDFESSLLELVAGSNSDDPQYGPVFRMPVTVRMRVDDEVLFKRGMYEIRLREDLRVPGAPATLTFEGEEQVYENADLSRIIDHLPGAECCGTCQFGVHCIYGGGDTLFGLHCFRDARGILADRGLYIEASQNLDEVAYPHTPLLHWCPSFQKWDAEYQKWTEENPPNPR